MAGSTENSSGSVTPEAYLIPTWLMQEQRLAQVEINQ